MTLALFPDAETGCVIARQWAMPSPWTFTIPPIAELIGRHMTDGQWVNPFSGLHVIGTVTNDINPAMPSQFHMDAVDFLREQSTGSADGVLFDPPYSPRQVAEAYRVLGIEVTTEMTQSALHGKCKDEIARIVRPGGTVITCGWNSGGVGQQRGFDMVEILLVAHGGWHNDTIVTVEKKRELW